MDISGSGQTSILSDYKRIGLRSSEVFEKLGSGKQVSRASDDPRRWGDVARLRAASARSWAHSENLGRAATSVRIATGSMETAAAQLDEMDKALVSAREAPLGSEARRQSLAHYNELHRLTDQLSQPQDLGARKLLDAPGRFGAAGSLAVAAGEGGFEITLRHQPIHLGAAGLDIPEAGAPEPSVAELENTSDDAIEELRARLGAGREVLSGRMSALAADSAAVERASAAGEARAGALEQSAAELEAADLEAEAVLAQALSLRSNLALSGLSGLEATRSMLLQLIR